MSKKCRLLPVFVVLLGMTGAITHADNQLRNWEFDEPLGSANWWLWQTSDFERVEPVPDTTMSGDMSLRIVIPAGSAGSLQLIQSYLELVQGQTYYISFMARADAPRQISAMLLGRSTHNWAQYWLAPDIQLTKQTQTFTFEYKHTGPTVGGTGVFNDDIDLYFNLNQSDIDLNIDRVWMDTVPPPDFEVPVAARKPAPANLATDVPIDVILGWTAGEYAATHDVYLGTAFDDVNDAGAADPRGVLVSQGQADAAYEPAGPLEYSQTYYWRVDEVNAAPDSTIFRGDVWRFTTEPFAYPITSPVTATASSFQTGMGPQNTINGSGLNANDEHSSESTQMWMSTGAKPSWIQYEFDALYKLHEMWVWNSNQLIESFVGFGARNVTVEYSTDGQTWTQLEGVPEFARAAGAPTYTHNTTIDFGGVVARYVRLTIASNWGGVAPQAGLSEVRFFHIPLRARGPEPAVGAADVRVDTELSWRSGREAASHQVYLGVDENALALVDTVTEHSYAPALDFGTTYFWKVNEAGAAGVYEGDVWSFTTQEYAVVDDFESYTDNVEAETTIWHVWIDGLTTKVSGSQVGYSMAPFAERSTVHDGVQAMPLTYDNSASPYYSEAERAFDAPQDWTAHGADSLSLYFQGAADNSSERVYLTLKDKAGKSKTVVHPDPAATVATGWQQWKIPLSEFTAAGVNVAAVKSIVIGVGNRTAPTAGGAGKVFIDDIVYGRSAQ